eukprot:2354871-Amphidinium_carterae.1
MSSVMRVASRTSPPVLRHVHQYVNTPTRQLISRTRTCGTRRAPRLPAFHSHKGTHRHPTICSTVNARMEVENHLPHKEHREE